MIVRLVKLTLRPEGTDRFRELFEDWRHRIIAFPGCLHLELLHDTHKKGVFFTYSVWRSADDLEAYRHSDVFTSVWPVVKGLFDAPAQAWSTEREHSMDADRTTP
ncbi:MAG: antibiotic biosynthesis monooxygenase family protein [Flavobacteriales bacterium]